MQHRLDFYDKLITPLMSYAGEVLEFIKGNSIENVHMQFCKRMLGVKANTQNDFIYGELGRVNFQAQRFYIMIKYWTKLLITNDDNNKFNKKIYILLC